MKCANKAGPLWQGLLSPAFPPFAPPSPMGVAVGALQPKGTVKASTALDQARKELQKVEQRRGSVAAHVREADNKLKTLTDVKLGKTLRHLFVLRIWFFFVDLLSSLSFQSVGLYLVQILVSQKVDPPALGA